MSKDIVGSINVKTQVRDWFREQGLSSNSTRSLHLEAVLASVNNLGDVEINGVTIRYALVKVKAHACVTFPTRQAALVWVQFMDASLPEFAGSAVPF